MATTPHKNLTAGEDLSANKDRYVKFDGSGDAVASTLAAQPIAIQTDKPASGETVGVAKVGGQAKLKIGGTVAAGDLLGSDANARGITVTADQEWYGAMALQSGVVDDLINVEVVSATQVSRSFA